MRNQTILSLERMSRLKNDPTCCEMRKYSLLYLNKFKVSNLNLVCFCGDR